MSRKPLFAALALLFLTARASAQFAEGPRALGMGGAYVAVANDMFAPFWNPAGASDAKGLHAVFLDLQASVSGPASFTDLLHHFPSSTAAQEALIQKLGGGISVVNASGDFAIGRDGLILSIAPLAYGTITPTSPNQSGGTNTGFLIDQSTGLPIAGSKGSFDGVTGMVYMATFGRRITSGTGVGLNLKLVSASATHSEVDYVAGASGTQVVTPAADRSPTSTTINMDLGVQQKLSIFTLGAIWRNFFGQNNNGVTPKRIDLGASAQPFGHRLLLSADLDDFGVAGLGRLNFGGEFAMGPLAVRAGMYRSQLTFGAGFGKYFNVSLSAEGTIAGVAIGF
jgi:hypothetical protein